ncbi:MAG: hypothetical protein ACQ9MH_13270 [Nitrospinales bacterium]
MRNNYKEPEHIEKDEFLTTLATNKVKPLCHAIVGVVHSIDDYDWLLKHFILLLEHPASEVRCVTVTCIGHLARLNDDADKDQLIEILTPLLSDNVLAGPAEDAIEDIQKFL